MSNILGNIYSYYQNANPYANVVVAPPIVIPPVWGGGSGENNPFCICPPSGYGPGAPGSHCFPDYPGGPGFPGLPGGPFPFDPWGGGGIPGMFPPFPPGGGSPQPSGNPMMMQEFLMPMVFFLLIQELFGGDSGDNSSTGNPIGDAIQDFVDGILDLIDPPGEGPGGTGDPHLVDMSTDYRHWYEFQGEGGKVYNWFSDDTVQLNAKMKTWNNTTEAENAEGNNMTVIDEVGLRLKRTQGDDALIRFNSDGTASYTNENGEEVTLEAGDSVSFEVAEGTATLTVEEDENGKHTLKMHVDGQQTDEEGNTSTQQIMNFEFKSSGSHIDITNAYKANTDGTYSDGILGATNDGDGVGRGYWDANGDGRIDFLNGEGIINGQASDYEIADGDIFGLTANDARTVRFGTLQDDAPDYDGDGKADANFIRLANGETILDSVRYEGRLIGVQRIGDRYYINMGVNEETGQVDLREVTVDGQNVTVSDQVTSHRYLNYEDIHNTIWERVAINAYLNQNGIEHQGDDNGNGLDDAVEDENGTFGLKQAFIDWVVERLNHEYQWSPWAMDGNQVQKTRIGGATEGGGEDP